MKVQEVQEVESFHKKSVILASFFLYKHKIYAGEAYRKSPKYSDTQKYLL